jgi:phenylacetate-coenzyme A ligase PaaK-like adenylate-forming protein
MLSNSEIFNIQTHKQFDKIALQIFRFQYQNNAVYHNFCTLLKINVSQVKTIKQIPFLPIQFFKSHKVVSNIDEAEQVFTSSGTTGTSTSQHFVTDVSVYKQSYLQGFSMFYGDIQDYVVLALLPSYQQRTGSSLIYMVDDLIQKTNNLDSGYFLENHYDLLQRINKLQTENKNIILIGVTFALLDLLETIKKSDSNFDGSNLIVIETGGMKGRRREIIREELHQILQNDFGVSSIHSEYGMTELLSQAYSLGDGVFECPPWMQISIRDTEDAQTYVNIGRTGGINVIDLANINSCSFIATQDLGKLHQNGTFEVLGRFDNSDIRGCNLMV